LIVHLPGQTSQKPTLRDFTHVTDNTATFLAVAQISPPSQAAPALINTLTGVDQNKGKVVYNNRYVYPITGQSLLPLLNDQATTTVHTASFGDEAYGRGYLRSADGRWKALWTEPPLGPVDGHWQLFDMSSDRGETQDLATQNPSVIDGLVQQWNNYMSSVGGVEPLRPRGYY
jgi:arylsulfatase